MKKVGTMLNLAVALIATALACGLLHKLATGSQFAAKFVERGLTPYVALFLTFWSIAIVARCFLQALNRQRALTAVYVLQDANLRTDADLQKAIDSTRVTSGRGDTTFANLVANVLERFRTTRSLRDASDVLSDDCQILEAHLDSGFSIVRVILWTIPIVGFIGTVTGVGQAVSDFAGVLSSSIKEIDEIKGALTDVTSNLGVAFDTTFVALFLSIVVMVLMSFAERYEKRQIYAFERYCRRHVLGRLSESASVKSKEDDLVGILCESLSLALAEVVPGIDFWKTEAGKLAEELNSVLAQSWKNSCDSWAMGVERIVAMMDESLTTHQEMLQEQRAWQTAQAEREDRLATLGDELPQKMVESVSKAWDGTCNSWKESVRGLEGKLDDVAALNGCLENLVAKQHKISTEQIQTLRQTYGSVESLVSLQNKLEVELLKSVGSKGLHSVMTDVKTTMQSLTPAITKLTEKPLDVKIRFQPEQTTVSGAG